MRDVGTQGGQERRARRDRVLAGRNRLIEFFRFAFAVALNAAAFIIWDVGTRPPAVLARDIAGGLRRPRTRALATALIRFATGFALAGYAALITHGATRGGTFVVVETAFVLAGLLIETLLGPTLRRAA